MYVLGIETSCDETAAAVIDEHGRVYSDVVHSQIEVHAPYGGVVPELASRDHLRHLAPVVSLALQRAGLSIAELDGIAVTCRPGLTGALLVGVQLAQGLAWATQKPVVGVDHLVGHLLAVYLQHPGVESIKPPPVPHVALLASGGHTALYRVRGLEAQAIEELGATRDDAAGEAFDKVAKLLGLGYPGGPVIDRLAEQGDPTRIDLARPMHHRRSLEFSFSGLKTCVARYVEQHGRPGNDQTLRDLCAAFQSRVVDMLLNKALEALRREQLQALVLAGGVAANRELRARAQSMARPLGVQVFVPPLLSCTDNAAMIALAGVQRLLQQQNDSGRLRVTSSSSLPAMTRKGPGRRSGTVSPR